MTAPDPHASARLRKAWSLRCHWYDDPSIIYAPTASKAKGIMYGRLSEFADGEEGRRAIFPSLRARRAAECDVYLPPVHRIVSELSAKELDVVRHAYGCDSRNPGYRSHFATHAGNLTLLRLAYEWLIFDGPYPDRLNERCHDGTPSMVFFYLNKLGKEVAYSTVPTYSHHDY